MNAAPTPPAAAPLQVAVTGGTGFIGSRLCRALTAAGYRVRTLIRPASDLSSLADLPDLDLYIGDVTERESLEPLMAGADVVFHIAAKVADWGPAAAFRAVNVGGVRHVLDAARDAGVRRVVHLSSASVYGFPGGRDLDEDLPFVKRRGDHYSATKRAGETLALSYHGNGIEVTALRPATVYGPGDHTTTEKIAAALLAGKFGLVDGGRHLMSPVYIDNLIQLMLRAAVHPAAGGEAFNVADDGYVTWREFCTWMAEALGVPPPTLSVPRRVAWPLAVAVDGLARAAGRRESPLINKYRIRAVMTDHHFSAVKAVRQLGYRPEIATRDGIERAIAWYLEANRPAAAA